MIKGLIRWSLTNRLAVLLVSAILLLAGAYVTATMPVDVFPDLTAPTVTVIVEGHGMAPEEMETLVTFPIETAVNGAADVRRVRSATAVGLTVVWVEFEWGTDIYRARQTVNERLGTVAGSLPPQVGPPLLAPVSSIMGEILFISLTSDRHDQLELRTVAKTDLRRRLLSVPGVSQVTPIGGDEKQYQVVLSPQRLRAYRLSLNDVSEALRAGNENVSPGFLIQGGQETIVRGIGRIQTTDDIANTVVVIRDGRPIKVGDLGVVQIGAAIRRGTAAASRRGPNWEPIIEPGVIVAIQKQPNANTLTLTRQLDEVLAEIQGALPEGMFINKDLFRQANFIEVSIHNTITALVEGGLMVILVVVLFLASGRASFITLLAIPMSLVTAILTLKAFGATINTMTLGGMAVAIGMLVDDAIIEVENIVRRLRANAALPPSERRTDFEVIYKAAFEVRAAVVFATIIILFVFCPLFFLSGMEGRLLRPLGMAFTVAMAASMAVALTVTPALAWLLLPSSSTVRRDREPWVVRTLKRLYLPVLNGSLRYPAAVVIPSVVLFIASVLGLLTMGRNFLPEFNEGALVVGVVTLPGTSLDESDALAGLVEQTLMQHPEIVAIGRRTGRAEEDEHVQGVEASEIDLTLDMDAPRRLGLPRRSKAELLEALRHDLAAIPGIQATFGQPIGHRIDHMLSGTRANIAVKIFGDDLVQLRQLAREVERLMQDIPGVVDLSTEQQAAVPMLRVEFDRSAIARHGLRITDVATTLTAALNGETVGQILEGRNAFDLVVQYGDRTNASPQTLREVLVAAPSGIKVPLKALARIYDDRGPNFISRENVQRKIVVMCNVAGRDMRGVVEDTRAAIAAQVDLPRGYYVEFGGQFESAEATNRRLAFLGVLVIIGIGFLLYIVFRSVRDTILIMVNLPLALIGGVVGVFVSGGVLSVASLIGFISVFGIATRNGIMLVSHIRHLQQDEGVTDFHEAVRRGATERLAPILMTALAAGLALIPLALRGDDPGTEILTPMAIVILFGLLSSTFLNMVVVPALFVRFGRPAGSGPVLPAGSGPVLPAALRLAPLLVLVSVAALQGCTQVNPHSDFVRARELIETSTGFAEAYDPYEPPMSEVEIEETLTDGLSMDEAIRLTLLNNRQLQGAFMDIGVAKAEWVQSGLLSNPSVDVLVRFPVDGGRSMIEATLVQNLLELWRIPIRKEMSQHRLDETVLRIARLAGELVAETKRAYYEAVAAQERHHVAVENLAVVTKSYEAVRSMREAGAASTFDENLVRGRLQVSQMAVLPTRLDVANAKRRLARRLSIDQDVDGVALIDPLPDIVTEPADPDELIEIARDSRLDLRAYAAAIKETNDRLRLEHSKAWGEIALGPSVERPATAGDTLVGVGFSLELPIFDQNQAQVAKAVYLLRQMVKSYESVYLAVAQDIRIDVDRANTALAGMGFYQEELLPQAEKNLSFAMESYAAGQSSILALFEAQQALLDAQKGHVMVRLETATALADLEETVGLPLESFQRRPGQ